MPHLTKLDLIAIIPSESITIQNYCKKGVPMEPKKLFENQRHVRSIKLPADKNHPYSFFNVAAMRIASNTLTGGAFKLYVYFCSYGPSYHEYIGKKNIELNTGLSKNSYLRAFKELEQHGYIQHDPNSQSPDDYIFVESGVAASHPNIQLDGGTCTQNGYTPCTQNGYSK